MTGPERPRPVPGPPRPPVSVGVAGQGPATGDAPAAGAGSAVVERDALAGLSGRPVSEHVAALEAEHDRLQRRLATIDQL